MSFPRYSGYKPSGVNWLGSIPAGWNLFRLKDIAMIINGYPFDSRYFDVNGQYPVVRIRDLNSSETEARYSGDFVESAVVTSSDVLIGMDGDFNVGRWLGSEAALLNQRVCCVRSESSELSTVLLHALPIPLKATNDITYSTTVKHLSSLDVEKVRVALPSQKDELAAIAAFLDRETAKVDTLVAEQEKLIALLEEKRQAVISHAVIKGLDLDVPMKPSGTEWLGDVPAHWDVVPLKWLTDPQRAIMYGIVLPGPDVGEGIPILKGGNVKPSRMNLGSMARTTPEIEAPYARARLKSGDLVYSIRGTIGDCEKVPPELEACNITQDVARVAVKGGVCAGWVRWALLASAVREELASGSLGAAVRGVNIFDLKRAMLPTPPFDEQVAISAFIEAETSKLDALTREAERAVTLLK
ncbi:MAG: restriction endonuclease subunit S, partial [Thermomicrobiales bacterium]